jgi:hypothetical protein
MGRRWTRKYLLSAWGLSISVLLPCTIKAKLAQAALRAVAALCLFDHEPRSEVTDNLRLIPTILVSLSHRHIGVRFAACQCVRVLGRAVKVIRTNIVDSGLGKTVFQIFKKQDEDRNVTNAALSAVCNIVNDFSPLRPVSHTAYSLWTSLIGC